MPAATRHFPEMILVIYGKLCTSAWKNRFCHHEVTPMNSRYLRCAALPHLTIQWYLSHAGSDTLPSTVLTCLNNGPGRLQQVSHPQVNFTIPVWRSLGVSSDIVAKVEKLMTSDKAYSICHQINCGTWQCHFQSTRWKERNFLQNFYFDPKSHISTSFCSLDLQCRQS